MFGICGERFRKSLSPVLSPTVPDCGVYPLKRDIQEYRAASRQEASQLRFAAANGWHKQILSFDNSLGENLCEFGILGKTLAGLGGKIVSFVVSIKL